MSSDQRSEKPAANAAEGRTEARRRFLKKAGTIALAAPVMESLSREGLLVRSAHAQTIQFVQLNGPFEGSIS